MGAETNAALAGTLAKTRYEETGQDDECLAQASPLQVVIAH
jgi:hypothetical protein